jgi:hypothetical protein
MTSVDFVASKNCRDCGKRIYLDHIKKKFYSNPSLKVFHACENWRPQPKPDVMELYSELLNKMNLLQSSQNDLSHQIVQLQTDIGIIKRNLWEIGQRVEEKVTQ